MIGWLSVCTQGSIDLYVIIGTLRKYFGVHPGYIQFGARLRKQYCPKPTCLYYILLYHFRLDA